MSVRPRTTTTVIVSARSITPVVQSFARPPPMTCRRARGCSAQCRTRVINRSHHMRDVLAFRPPHRRGRRYDTRHNLHHLLAYDFVDAAGGGTLTDSVAVADQSFSQRNGHYIFTEPYQLIASQVLGASATDGRL